jgi:hypothetical protein
MARVGEEGEEKGKYEYNRTEDHPVGVYLQPIAWLRDGF